MANLSAGPLFLILAGSVGPLAVAPVCAQGLGEVATREKQKRQSQPKPARVYTQDDLTGTKGTITGTDGPAAAPGSDATPVTDAQSPPANAAGGPPPSEPAPAGRSGDAGASLDEAEATLAVEQDRQERILLEADWRTRFAGARQRLAVAEAEAWRDEYEISMYYGVPIRTKKRVRFETDELKRARREFEELEEEFRRTGLPAGWAREE